MSRTLFLTLLILLLGVAQVRAQAGLPLCENRPTFVDPPWVNGAVWCLERVFTSPDPAELDFTALAAAPDATLYATRPLSGQVLAFTDTDQDGLPDTPRVVADNLTLPNGLAYFDNALYVSGGSHIYRIVGDEVETLVDDLPTGAGFWTGGLTVGPDERIYVALGASCDFCADSDPQRGAIWSYALDGSDPQLVATGLRQPTDLVFREGILYTLDTARDGQPLDTQLDELNRVTPGADFGWPYCIGNNQPDELDPAYDCTSAVPPVFTFATHSMPLGMAVYESDLFPDIHGHLLVVLGGSYNEAYLNGYTLVDVSFDEQGNPVSQHIIIPEKSSSPIQPGIQTIQYQGSGFWPHRPYDVTVSPEGWLYISVGGGRILALRPAGTT